MSSDELRQIQFKYFLRYDLDDSKTINNREELAQLSTNLVIKLDLNVKLDELQACVDSVGDNIDWDFEEFQEWFDNKILASSM